MSGAASAITTMSRPTRPPTTAIGLRRAKPASSRAREPAGTVATRPSAGAACTSAGRPISAVPDARVEPAVADVDQHVDEDEDQRVEQHQVLHHDGVALDHRRDERAAEAGDAQGLLD